MAYNIGSNITHKSVDMSTGTIQKLFFAQVKKITLNNGGVYNVYR